MDMFKMLKQARELQVQAKKIEQELRSKTIQVNTGGIDILINGKQELVSLKISPEVLKETNTEKLEQIFLRAVNDAIRKSQDLVTSEIKKISGGLNIPGLG